MSWIITKGGFVSLVQHEKNPNMLRARARREEHLVNTFGLDPADILDLGANAPDYRWHADIPRVVAAEAIAQAVMDIDYTSHVKESVSGRDDQMYRAMLRCWDALYTLQRQPPTPPPPVRSSWSAPRRKQKKQRKWRHVKVTDGAQQRAAVVFTASTKEAEERAIEMTADAWKVDPASLTEVEQRIISADAAHQLLAGWLTS
jgi:hypothetical protein